MDRIYRLYEAGIITQEQVEQAERDFAALDEYIEGERRNR